MSSKTFETRALSSLSKVFADAELKDRAFAAGSALLGEIFSFQLAYRSGSLIKGLEIKVQSVLARYIDVRQVGLVPSEFPGAHFDRHVLRNTPGLYPDPLYPLESGVDALPGQWRSLWVRIQLPRRGLSGKYPISIHLRKDGVKLGSETFMLAIIPVALPTQKLVHTNWFHADCIATYYGDEMWSLAHWRRLEQFMRSAAAHGVNLLLTPLFTPPLDTQVGGERPTVQLVDVEDRGGDYKFGFKRLGRWIETAQKCGVRSFEMSHFFTQWGAAHCPKIVAQQQGKMRKIFGWKDSASGSKYRRFLDQFLPQLVRYIDKRGLRKRCYFHVSDEPHKDHLEAFAKAAAILHGHLQGFPFIDALSNIEYYEKGLVRHPIPPSNHIEPFVQKGIKHLWTYYCVSQWDEVSNRFFCMPSARNRILGTQLFKYDLAGFLHWGFNFYYTQYSTRPLDPFVETDAGHAFPSGDAYLVYPGPDGPIDSIRGQVFFEALQDQRALQLLAKLEGRTKAIRLVERGLDEEITMKKYPRDMAWLLAMRQRCNRRIGALEKG